ncbi:MAG: DUF2764 domain-containing protein [Alistipes sp.]|jgi:hypothetical protein|nr:DUF2764 domain-containing protein [Alistipes sp.]
MFLSTQYYALIAGLREWTLDGADKGFDATETYGEIRRELSPKDRRTAALLWSLVDIYGLERTRVEWLYDRCEASRCDFLKDWARFDRNLRNIVAAHTARAKGMEVASNLLGGGDIVEALAKSSVADFSLRGELEYIDSLLGALDGKTGIVEKERAIDLIRWSKAESMAEFDSFGMPTVLSYLIKIGIIHRWEALDPEVGRQMYEKLLAAVKSEVKIAQ